MPKYMHPKTLLFFTALPIAIFLGLFALDHSYFSFLVTALLLSFFTSANVNASRILTGYFSTHETIAKNFGWIGLSSIIATLVGGVIIGPSLDYFGYAVSFISFGFVFLVSNLLFLKVEKPIIDEVHHQQSKVKLSGNTLVLLVASLLIIMLIHVFKMSISLELKKSGYSLKDISLLSSVGTILVLPFPYLLGYLEKYFSSKKLLLFCYLVTVVAFLLLGFTQNYFGLALAISCISILAYASVTPVMSLLHQWHGRTTFGKVQTYYGNMAWLAAIIGYTLTGHLLESYSFQTTVWVGFLIAVLASLLLRVGVKNGDET
jgi:MFS family permease